MKQGKLECRDVYRAQERLLIQRARKLGLDIHIHIKPDGARAYHNADDEEIGRSLDALQAYIICGA